MLFLAAIWLLSGKVATSSCTCLKRSHRAAIVQLDMEGSKLVTRFVTATESSKFLTQA